MPRDVSSSSSEDEGNSPVEASFRQKQVEKSSKYQCPDDFVCFSHKPCSSTLIESLKCNKSELWLIKAPASFDPRCFRGASVNLSGFQTLKLPFAAGKGHDQQIYNILASNHGPSDLRLLTSASSSPVVGPAFTGLLSVCESYGGAPLHPGVVHATPTPAIPPGLKQRFQPFGSKTPTTTQESQGEDRKKKKKKDKHTKTEEKEEEVRVKQEVEETGQEHSEEKSRRKRKKKEREEVAIVEVKQEVKCELDVGAFYKDDCSAKKKKKKKKSKTDDD